MKRRSFYTAFVFGLTVVFLSHPVFSASETIKIATWNIEHLGSPGRGFGGIGAGNLSQRSPQQLKDIAKFIKNDLQTDLLALQEVAVHEIKDGVRISKPLDKIKQELGPKWKYYIGLPGSCYIDFGSKHNMQNAFLWNSEKVNAVKIFSFRFPNEKVGKKKLFDRLPLIGYFQVLKNQNDTNDFALVNVHLTSGQDSDENHLAAMVIIEQNLSNVLKEENITETDRIILGDFNDNQFAKNDDGFPRYTAFLYEYMEYKKYTGLVKAETGATRMDKNLQSIIDKIMVNKGAMRDLKSATITKYMPQDSSPEGLAKWRKTCSDHFPLVIEMKVANKDTDVD